MRKKRGQQRTYFRISRFSLPTSTVFCTLFSPTPVPTPTAFSSSIAARTVEKGLKLTEKQLVERRQRIGVLSEENIKLKRKQDRSKPHKEEVKKLKRDLMASIQRQKLS